MIGIIDINTGNLTSIYNALNSIGFESKIINPDSIKSNYSHIILPGVGNFFETMKFNKKKDYVKSILNFAITGKPILGICLGMQLMGTYSEETKKTDGFNLIPGRTVPFKNVPVPHVGWNNVIYQKDSFLFNEIKNNGDFYFVHSYFFITDKQEYIIATSEYKKINFASVIRKNNVIGCQFHPEKSQKNGLRFLKNFCSWRGLC